MYGVFRLVSLGPFTSEEVTLDSVMGTSAIMWSRLGHVFYHMHQIFIINIGQLIIYIQLQILGNILWVKNAFNEHISGNMADNSLDDL